MEEKNALVLEYINGIKETFKKNGNPISDEIVSKVTGQYMNSSKSFEEIKEEIDKLVEKKLEELRKKSELMEKMQPKLTKGITDLSVETKGITLNMQQIDLLSIVTADETNFNQMLANILNLTDEQKQSILSSDKSLDEIKRDLFRLYQDSLMSYVDTNFSLDQLGKERELSKKIEFVLNNCGLSKEQQRQFVDIVNNNQLYDIPKIIVETYDKDVSDRIFKTLIRYMPTEKEGIKSASYESFERLAKHLSDYQVINLDEIAKYGHYVRQDGGFNSDDLTKAFDFARRHGMQTRLNTLLFYMDTPQILESMPFEQGKVEAKILLERYVEDITSVIAKYNEDCIQRGEKPVVRTVEIFNELLNRFAMNGNVPYEYRGHIDTDEHRISKDDPNYDNLRAGWLRFFEVEELCSIMEIARRNLPNVNFMLNECTLEDSRKIEPFKKLVIDKIKAYEQQHGIKLIDSIGTQMHIDSSVSKDDIRTMFENLSQFGLPIEVTEFDMAIDQNFINSHTQEEIEAFKRQKINDFCDVVVEMQEKANISGVTIWSVSDAQNFVIHIINKKIYIKNLERQKAGLEPIPYVKTLYGGYYSAEMEDITKSNEFNQEFNYHTHTYRSGHSEYVSDEEMLQVAKSMGISMLGFSEHIPNPDLILPDEDHRMLLSEVDGYIASINKLKQDNQDMTILIGFEAEFDPMKEAFLGEMRDKVDYMILGQHFVNRGLQMIPSKNNPNYPIEYANMICKAIESGIFDIVAHPDHFMKFRDTIVSEEDRKIFDKNATIASQIICEKARDMGIPIEINLSPALYNQILSDGNLAYPHPTFWKVAQEIEGLKVLKGVDAHDLSAFKNVSQAEQLIANIEQMVSDKLIQGGYNPVIARQNNPKLQQAYANGQANALTFETHMISQIINGSLSRTQEGLDSESLAIAVGNSLNGVMQICVDGASKKDKSTVEEISTIADFTGLSFKNKKGKLERKKQAINETNQILANQQKAIESAKNSVLNAMSIGCENKQEYSNMVTKMTQYKTTKKETQKSKIEEHIASFKQTKSGKKINAQKKVQVKVLKKDNNTRNSSSGFTNVIMITLIATFIIGVAVGVGYMLYKFNIGG